MLLLSGCMTADPALPVLTVGDVWARHHELDGAPIRVEGVVTRCYNLGCRLQETADQKGKWLSIGTSADFDEKVQQFLGKRIVVTGRLRADCLHVHADADQGERNQHVIICTDRASMIIKPKFAGLAR